MPPPRPASSMAIDFSHDDDPTSDYDDAPPSHASLKHIAPQSTVFNPPPPTSQTTTTEVKIDHRKKRRNRTTQSCLSCHQNKRKCDRGRPCGRCITLGLTGYCVYEVGERTRDKDADQVTTLRNRVAELEGVVRELKNKPQPRWAANALAAATTTTTTAGTPAPPSSSSSSSATALPNGGPLDSTAIAPETPRVSAPLQFPKESWHVRSARKDRAVNNAGPPTPSTPGLTLTTTALSTAPAPTSTQLQDTARDREAERNATHAVHNTLNAFVDRENSVDFGTGVNPFGSTPYSYATSGWNNGKGYPGLSGGTTSKGKRKLSDVHHPLDNTTTTTTTTAAHAHSYQHSSFDDFNNHAGLDNGLGSPFGTSGQHNSNGNVLGSSSAMSPTPSFGAAANGNALRRPSTGLGFASTNTSQRPMFPPPAAPTPAPQQPSSYSTSQFSAPSPAPSHAAAAATATFNNVIGSGLAGLSAGAAGRQRSLTGPPPPISSRRPPHPPLSTSFLHPPARKVIAPGSVNGLSTATLTPPTPCTCLAPQGNGEDGVDVDGNTTETTAFVKNLLANVREVVGFLESVHPSSPKEKGDDGGGAGEDSGGRNFPPGVKGVSECAVVRCLNQLDRAIRVSHNAGRRTTPSPSLAAVVANGTTSAPNSPHGHHHHGHPPHNAHGRTSRPSSSRAHTGFAPTAHQPHLQHPHIQQSQQQQPPPPQLHHAHAVEDESIPPPLTPPAHLGYLSPTHSDAGNPPVEGGVQANGNEQLELEMGILEAQQQAHLEELHQQQARERQEHRRQLEQQHQQEYEAQQRGYEQQQHQQQHHDASGPGPDMDWDVVLSGGPPERSGSRSGNGGDAPSPIELLSREALDALRDDAHHHHRQQSLPPQRQMSYDRRPSYEGRQSASFAQGFARSIGTASAPQVQQQQHSPYASSPLAAQPHSAPASRRGSAHSVSAGDSPAARSNASAPVVSQQNQMEDTFAFGSYDLDPNDAGDDIDGNNGAVAGGNNANGNNGGGAGELDELNQHHHHDHIDIDLDSGAHGSYEGFFPNDEFYA